MNYYHQFKRAGDQLATERFTETQLRRVLNELYPSGTDDSASDRTRRSREQTKQRITDLFIHGDTRGNAPGTKWTAINAVIEHADYWQSAVMRSRSPAAPQSCVVGPVDFG
jgi:calcineurin-like phosphoesterase family protein